MTVMTPTELAALGYDFTPEQARESAKLIGETPSAWAKGWAVTIRARCSDLGLSCPSRSALRWAIERGMAEDRDMQTPDEVERPSGC